MKKYLTEIWFGVGSGFFLSVIPMVAAGQYGLILSFFWEIDIFLALLANLFFYLIILVFVYSILRLIFPSLNHHSWLQGCRIYVIAGIVFSVITFAIIFLLFLITFNPQIG